MKNTARQGNFTRRSRISPPAISLAVRRISLKKSPMQMHRGLFKCYWVYKPGSVLTAIYLVVQLLTRSSRLLEAVGPTCMLLHGVASDRVYSTPVFPRSGWSLTPPFHLFPRPKSEVVSLCCTCPEVTLGGRYPLSLPYEARTFLTWCFSASSRGCPTQLRLYFTPFCFDCQTSCKMFLK